MPSERLVRRHPRLPETNEMSARIDRALLLIQQSRPSEASVNSCLPWWRIRPRPGPCPISRTEPALSREERRSLEDCAIGGGAFTPDEALLPSYQCFRAAIGWSGKKRRCRGERGDPPRSRKRRPFWRCWPRSAWRSATGLRRWLRPSKASP